MRYKNLITTYVVVLLGFGFPLILFPAPFIVVFGADLANPGEVMSRFYGASMLGVALMMWRARNSPPSDTLEGLLHGNLVIWGLSLFIAILGQFQHTFNRLGLVVAGLSVFFSGWYFVLRMADRKDSVLQ